MSPDLNAPPPRAASRTTRCHRRTLEDRAERDLHRTPRASTTDHQWSKRGKTLNSRNRRSEPTPKLYAPPPYNHAGKGTQAPGKPHRRHIRLHSHRNSTSADENLRTENPRTNQSPETRRSNRRPQAVPPPDTRLKKLQSRQI